MCNSKNHQLINIGVIVTVTKCLTETTEEEKNIDLPYDSDCFLNHSREVGSLEMTNHYPQEAEWSKKGTGQDTAPKDIL